MARNKNSVPSQAHPVKQEPDSPEENSSSGEEEEIEIEEEVEEEVEVEEDEEEEERDGDGKSSPSEEEESGEEEEEEEEEEESSSEEEEEEEDEASKLESIKSLLKPFTKDQLITILKEASSQNPSLLSGLIKTAEADPIHRKIFVHGLGWDVTNETLTAAFKPYGQIEECNVVLDKATGRCKGYGFVLFKTRIGAKKALKEPQKRIGKGNRVASCQLAAAGSSGSNSNVGNAAGLAIDPTSRKMYIANVGPLVSVEKLRAFFAKFGEIENGPTGMDKVTGKFRGFAIIVFKTVEGMKKALQEPVKEFEGCKLQCSVFIEKNVKQSNANANVGGSSGSVGSVGMQSMPFGLNQGLVGQGFNPGAVLLGQNPGITVLNPLLGIGAGSGLNPAALYPGPVSTSLTRNAASPAGLSGGVQQDISSMSPGLANNYGSQSSLQGMGAYYGAQLGQSSASGGGGSGKGQSGGVGSGGSASTYYGR